VGGWSLESLRLSLFNPVVFHFPCTPLLSALLTLTFPICLGKQEIEKERGEID
jgi:hypothetical protein